ncbi:unnamed protein product, partial [Chrysoparadoxa australica]
MGLYDPWSEVRRITSLLLEKILPLLPVAFTERLYLHMLHSCQLCIGNKSDWKRTHGLLLGMQKVIRWSTSERQHQGVTLLPDGLFSPGSGTVDLLFSCLGHCQQAVQKVGQSALLTVSGALGSAGMLDLLDAVTHMAWEQKSKSQKHRQQEGTEYTKTELEIEAGRGGIIHAKTGEGLLGVLRQVIPKVPIEALRVRWRKLMMLLKGLWWHEASAVRQLVSSVLQQVAQRHGFAVLVIGGIANAWDELGAQWQGWEGALMTYEAILKDILNTH